MPTPLTGGTHALAAVLEDSRGEAENQLLTHRRAEVEPLLAWADRILMKALEVSENFLMSTGLGTLQERTEKVRVPEGPPKAAGTALPWSEGGSWTEGGSAGLSLSK